MHENDAQHRCTWTKDISFLYSFLSDSHSYRISYSIEFFWNVKMSLSKTSEPYNCSTELGLESSYVIGEWYSHCPSNLIWSWWWYHNFEKSVYEFYFFLNNGWKTQYHSFRSLVRYKNDAFSLHCDKQLYLKTLENDVQSWLCKAICWGPPSTSNKVCCPLATALLNCFTSQKNIW